MIDNDDVIEVDTMPFAVKHGLILSVISLALTVVIYLTGQMANNWAGYLSMVVGAVIIFFFQKKFRDSLQGGYIRFGKAFSIGFVMNAISALIGSIASYFIFKYDSTISEIMAERQFEEMVNRGMTSSEIDATMDITEKFMTPGMLSVFGFLMILFFVSLFTLITSAIVKRNHPNDVF